jgi:hypothetical protein
MERSGLRPFFPVRACVPFLWVRSYVGGCCAYVKKIGTSRTHGVWPILAGVLCELDLPWVDTEQCVPCESDLTWVDAVHLSSCSFHNSALWPVWAGVPCKLDLPWVDTVQCVNVFLASLTFLYRDGCCTCMCHNRTSMTQPYDLFELVFLCEVGFFGLYSYNDSGLHRWNME